MEAKDAVKEYQCPGCTNGPALECYKKADFSHSCGDHFPGTSMMVVGNFFLGMPKGFNRVGPLKSEFKFMPQIYKTWDEFMETYQGYDKFNVPAWKHLNEHGHTLIRGLQPRTNQPFLHIILEDVLDKVDCIEISEEEIKAMD